MSVEHPDKQNLQTFIETKLIDHVLPQFSESKEVYVGFQVTRSQITDAGEYYNPNYAYVIKFDIATRTSTYIGCRTNIFWYQIPRSVMKEDSLNQCIFTNRQMATDMGNDNNLFFLTRLIILDKDSGELCIKKHYYSML